MNPKVNAFARKSILSHGCYCRWKRLAFGLHILQLG